MNRLHQLGQVCVVTVSCQPFGPSPHWPSVDPLEPPDSIHLEAAVGWIELGNHEEADEELDKIEATLRVHPNVLEVRWIIHAKVQHWELCKYIGSTLVKLAPERTTGWIHRSFALHELELTQEAYDALKPALDTFKDEQLIWYNMACYACVLGNKTEARELLDKAIELGGNAVKVQALNDPDLLGVWGGKRKD